MEFEKKSKQTPVKKQYDRKYRREKMLSISFRLSRIYDQELIEIYESIPDKSYWFKTSLRRYAEQKKTG